MDPLDSYDVLNPKLVVIDGVCYRTGDLGNAEPKTAKKSAQPPGYYEEGQYDMDNDCDIEILDNGKCKTRITIPKQFFSYVIGTKGSRRRALEEDTKTQINVPNQNQGEVITITGSKAADVARAYRQIELMSIGLREKHAVTHFLSFRMFNENIKENFIKFKEEILSGKQVSGLHESIFQNENKLHLTVGVMVLLSAREIEQACDIMSDCEEKIIRPKLSGHNPLTIQMRGLEYMNDDPSQVDVLYAKVREQDGKTGVLQELCNDIVDFFYQNGIMKMERDNVKLHCTLLNTRYRKENTDRPESNSRSTKRVSFDARPILDKFGDYYFGQITLKQLELSNRSVQDENGYYASEFAVSC